MKKLIKNKRKEIAFGIMIALSLLIFVECIGHIAYYLTYKDFFWNKGDSREWNQFTLYGSVEYVPNSTIGQVGGKIAAKLGVDCNGFVHNGYNKKINKEDYLIVICGGSTVVGYGASSNNTTIAAYLENILNSQFTSTGRNIRVVNAGHSGYIAYQQFSLVNGKILSTLKPDIVIDLDGFNDALNIIGYADYGWKPNWQPYFNRVTDDINSVMREGPIRPTITLFVNSFKRYSTILTALDRVLHGEVVATKNFQHPQNNKPSKDITQEAVDSYIHNHAMSQAACSLRGTQYYAFLQPVLLNNKKPLTKKEQQIASDWEKHFKHGFFWESLQNFYTAAEQKTENFSYFFNISDLFYEVDDQVYYDCAHYNDAGNYLIAQKISAIIRKNIHLNNK